MTTVNPRHPIVLFVSILLSAAVQSGAVESDTQNSDTLFPTVSRIGLPFQPQSLPPTISPTRRKFAQTHAKS